MIKELKQLRLEIDATTKLVKLSTYLPDSRDANHSNNMLACVKSLYMAKAYVGKLLGEMNDPSPYKNEGNRIDVKDIEPTDAVSEDIKLDVRKTYVGNVDWIRQHIEDYLIKQVKDSYNQQFTTPFASIYRTQVLVHLTDARLHLGFELARIREEAEDAKN